MPFIGKKKELEDAGFHYQHTVDVLLPFHIWYVTLLLEYDRELRLLEETILKLIAVGLRDQRGIAIYMGLEEDEVYRLTLLDLLDQQLIRAGEAELALTSQGERAVRHALTRVQRTFDSVPLRYDPYRDQLGWYEEGSLLDASATGQDGVFTMPDVTTLTIDSMKERHPEIQHLISQQGLPFDPDKTRQKDVILIDPLRYDVYFRRVALEVWEHSGVVGWRLVQGDVELHDEARAFRELEQEGIDILANVFAADAWPP